jgi:hypothetical protein
MSRTPRFPEPTQDAIAEQQRVLATLMGYATGRVPVDKLSVQKHMNPFLQLAEFGGVLNGQPFPPLSYFPVFKLHLDAAAQTANGPLLAALTLALVLIYQFERHMPDYAKSIRAKQQTGRDSASKRRAEGKNTRTLIEAWERETDRPLSPQSSTKYIAACASKIGRKEPTVLNDLYLRERERRAVSET